MGDVMTPPEAICRLYQVMQAYLTEESHMKGVNFKPEPNDVIISTGAKSGTTWVQQICHGLRSGGDMSFDEICLVIPCLEMAHDYGYTDLHAPQPYAPQMFKTHMWYPSCPKGAGKYIVVARQPADAALSFYHFLANWAFSGEEIHAEEFIEWIYLKRGVPKSQTENSSQIHHIMSWYPYRLNKNVLWLHFEDLKQNLRECVRLISEFLDIGVDDKRLQDLVAHQATFEFMKKHSTKFDEHPLKQSRNEAVGFPPSAGFKGNHGKVRKGESNYGQRILPKHILEKINKKWRDVVTSETGYETYEAFRAGVNKELGRQFN